MYPRWARYSAIAPSSFRHVRLLHHARSRCVCSRFVPGSYYRYLQDPKRSSTLSPHHREGPQRGRYGASIRRFEISLRPFNISRTSSFLFSSRSVRPRRSNLWTSHISSSQRMYFCLSSIGFSSPSRFALLRMWDEPACAREPPLSSRSFLSVRGIELFVLSYPSLFYADPCWFREPSSKNRPKRRQPAPASKRPIGAI